ncbi:uncharacterized protein L3040_007580 [Drepanopeziza brunnea f. sp. 'multigermtubi']|uniref:uncharacterized protein n=1 Tax=Drepanopeziza brunnea f. sp. 'multigermtubi' TaxID=698441 RepID=UPI00239D78BB|nr:hypothetical protein L3040_007580 [Drepanopeziza brunnea f. sp. 'multigermtubi']
MRSTKSRKGRALAEANGIPAFVRLDLLSFDELQEISWELEEKVFTSGRAISKPAYVRQLKDIKIDELKEFTKKIENLAEDPTCGGLDHPTKLLIHKEVLRRIASYQEQIETSKRSHEKRIRIPYTQSFNKRVASQTDSFIRSPSWPHDRKRINNTDFAMNEAIKWGREAPGFTFGNPQAREREQLRQQKQLFRAKIRDKNGKRPYIKMFRRQFHQQGTRDKVPLHAQLGPVPESLCILEVQPSMGVTYKPGTYDHEFYSGYGPEQKANSIQEERVRISHLAIDVKLKSPSTLRRDDTRQPYKALHAFIYHQRVYKMYLIRLPSFGLMPLTVKWSELTWEELVDEFGRKGVLTGDTKPNLRTLKEGMIGLYMEEKRAHEYWLSETKELIQFGHPEHASEDFHFLQRMVKNKLARSLVDCDKTILTHALAIAEFPTGSSGFIEGEIDRLRERLSARLEFLETDVAFSLAAVAQTRHDRDGQRRTRANGRPL